MLQCACVALIDSKGRVFVDKRKNTGPYANYWEVPGGKSDVNEDLKTTAIREVKEEIGVDLDPTHMHFLCTFENTVKNYQLHFYATHVWKGDIRLLAEQQDMRWCSIDELKELKMPEGNKVVIEALKLYVEGKF